MIDTKLVFKASTAERLMAIARDERLTNPAHVQILPNSWGTLYEITKLDDEEFKARVDDGTIRPDMQRQEITTEIKKRRRAEKETELAERITSLPQKRYGVILADPEWRFEPWSRLTGMDRAADNHYPTSATEVIASRPIADISADDCVLFLWATAPMLCHALVVMSAWGFDYRTNAVWVKDRICTGYWLRNKHEHLLIGVRGSPPCPAMGEQWESALRPRQPEEHSRKPNYFYRLIESYYPHIPKIELNARRKRTGWDAWGNEA